MNRPPKPATVPSACKSCGAEVFWVVWPSGKKMPVDSMPSEAGDIVLTFRRSENVLLAAKAERLDQEHLAERKRYVSHFASCPSASQHRRGA